MKKNEYLKQSVAVAESMDIMDDEEDLINFWDESAEEEQDAVQEEKLKHIIEGPKNLRDKQSMRQILLEERDRLTAVKYFGSLKEKNTREKMKERMKDIISAILDRDIDNVIFLDKSARLLGLFFKEAWRSLFLEKPCPSISFVNIGREKDTKETGVNGIPWMYVDYQSDDKIKNAVEDYVHQIHQAFGDKFQSKRIAVIDEFCHEGASLNIASETFKTAYPEAEVYGEWFHTSDDLIKFKRLKRLIKNDKYFIIDGKISNPFNTNNSGVIEPRDNKAVFADSWTRLKDFKTAVKNSEGSVVSERDISREEFVQIMKRERQQIKKLALEMMP